MKTWLSAKSGRWELGNLRRACRGRWLKIHCYTDTWFLNLVFTRTGIQESPQRTPPLLSAIITEPYSHRFHHWEAVRDPWLEVDPNYVSTTPPATRSSPRQQQPPHTIIIPITTTQPRPTTPQQPIPQPTAAWPPRERKTSGKTSMSCSTVFFKWWKRPNELWAFSRTERFIMRPRAVELPPLHPPPRRPGSGDPPTPPWTTQRTSNVRLEKWWLRL